MINYIHRFINWSFYSIIRNGNGTKERKESESYSTEYRNPSNARRSKENSCKTYSGKGTGRFGICRTTTCKKSSSRSKDCSRSLQGNKTLCMEGRKGKQSFASFNWEAWTQANEQARRINFFLFFIFSDYRLIPIIQAIDDICFQINPLLAGVLLK